MGYLHIKNLYADTTILLFREVFALEKIHGTSAHVSWNEWDVRFFSGGAPHAAFSALFDVASLRGLFDALGHPKVTIYGEAYGGKLQGMRATYGDALRFIAFDVLIGDSWLAVPQAEDVVAKLGIEFVPWVKTSTDLPTLDAIRDAPSEVAARRGVVGQRPREGIVLRPPIEVHTNNGERIIAKHKGEAFSETKTQREVDPAKRVVLEGAQAVADEWVTPMRLEHVLDGMTMNGAAPAIEQTRGVIAAMVEDVRREAAGEVEWSREVERAVGSVTAMLFRRWLASPLTEETG